SSPASLRRAARFFAGCWRQSVGSLPCCPLLSVCFLVLATGTILQNPPEVHPFSQELSVWTHLGFVPLLSRSRRKFTSSTLATRFSRPTLQAGRAPSLSSLYTVLVLTRRISESSFTVRAAGYSFRDFVISRLVNASSCMLT